MIDRIPITQNKELIFEMIFVDNLSTNEVENLENDLIVGLIEGNQLLFGGGGDHTCMRGGLSHQEDSKFDETKVQNLLLDFAEVHPHVKSVRFLDLQDFLNDGF